MKKAILIILILTLATATTTAKDYKTKTDKINDGYVTTITIKGKTAKIKTAKRLPVKMIAGEDMTLEKAQAREGHYSLIEKITGTVMDDQGNGQTSDGQYISYKGVKGATKGKTVTTYCIYNDSRWCDDIQYRFDF